LHQVLCSIFRSDRFRNDSTLPCETMHGHTHTGARQQHTGESVEYRRGLSVID
jgi:hypothetical protein